MPQNKKALPNEENKERISFQTGSSDDLLNVDYRTAGNSVNKHKSIESANLHLAEEEIKQINNNS